MTSPHIGAWIRSRSLELWEGWVRRLVGRRKGVSGALAAQPAPMLGRVLAAGLAMAALALAVPALSQTINTVAGGGAGDGGAATSASLNVPSGVALDASGNLYIADFGNHRIRRVDAATGIITTVAGTGGTAFVGEGGAATSASLNGPAAVALDASGNLYIADYLNHRIRKVDGATGIMTTVAGNGSATFAGDSGAATSASLNHPVGVAVDASGSLYIADYLNHRIRKVDGATRIITTVAGNGSATFAGDGGPATSASLNQPHGIALDASGNLHIADFINHRIRKVDAATGIITTVAGNGGSIVGNGGPATSASLEPPAGVAFDASGNLYIAEGSRIRKVLAATGIISNVAGTGAAGGGAIFCCDGLSANGAPLDNAIGVALDASGNVYIAVQYHQRIRKVVAATGIITTAAGSGAATIDGYGSFAGDGGLATSASLNLPFGVALDASGNLYIADLSNHRIRKIDTVTGIITTVAGSSSVGFAGDGGAATSASLKAPYGVALDVSGNLYIADHDNDRIRKVVAATGIITTVAGGGSGFTLGDGGAATSVRLNDPVGVALDASGNLYIADQGNHRIRKVDAATGIITTVAGNGSTAFAGDGGAATSASLQSPRAVTLDASGNLYIADSGHHRIRKVDAATGIITTAAGGGCNGFAGDGGAATSASLCSPSTVALDARGNLYIADSSNNRIRKVDTVTGIITTVAGNGSDNLPRFSGDGGPAISASLGFPFGVALDATGNLYIADYGNHRIRKVIFFTARGDFNGDGKSDIFWRHTDGTNYVWHVNGAVISGGVLSIASQGLLPGVADPGWSIAGVGDFNGDGKADILWRHTNGTNYVWHLDGSTINGGVLSIVSQGLLPGVPGPDWAVAGIGDFNGDGKADILWRRNDGTNYVWHVDGATINGGVLAIGSQGLLPGVDTSWSVVGTGDYNGDGKADVLWRRNDGTNYVWHVDGAAILGGVLAIASQGLLPGVDTSWSVVGTGDYNGDGKADVLWRRNDGTNYVWHVDGAVINGGVLAIGSQGLLPSVTDIYWSVVGSGDYNGDGKADVLWRHINGTNYIWHVDGATINSGVLSIPSQGLLPGVTDAGWQVQNPK